MKTFVSNHRKSILIVVGILMAVAAIVCAVFVRLSLTTITWKNVRYNDNNYVVYVSKESDYLYATIERGYLLSGRKTKFALVPANNVMIGKDEIAIENDSRKGIVRFIIGEEQILFDLESRALITK